MLRRISVAASQFEIIGPQDESGKIWCLVDPSHPGMPATRPKWCSSLILGHSPMSMHDALDRNRSGFAAADAEGRHAAFQVLRLQRVQQGHDQPRAGCADGVAERAGAAVDIQLVSID